MTKKKIIIIGVIIISSLVLFIIFKENNNNISTKKILFYNEKAINLKILEFGIDNKLKQKITAKSYTTYTKKNDIIELPEIKKFTQDGSYISADLAKRLTINNLELIGNVKITSINGIKHNLHTQSLFANLANNYFYSKQTVNYFSDKNIINASGIKIFNNKKLVQLLGKSNILLQSKNKIIGSNIDIKLIDGQNYISSKNKAQFVGINSIAETKNGFSLYKNKTTLFGDIILKQQNSTIYTKDLVIKNDIYVAKKSKYMTKDLIINADNIFYNETTQVMKLKQNVSAVYE